MKQALIALICLFGILTCSFKEEPTDEEIFTIYDLGQMHRDSSNRTFFVSGERASRLIAIARKPYLRHEHILKVNHIQGLKEKLRIQICEGSRNEDGSSIQGYGCWKDLRKSKTTIPEDEIWGVIVTITDKNGDLIINTPNKEACVRRFLLAL